MRNVNTSALSAEGASSLFGKTMMVLAGMMGVGAVGAYFGTGLVGLVGLGVAIGWILLTIVAVIAAAVATKNESALPFATLIMGGWTFVSGLVMGPAIAHYVADLGANTVLGAFLGTSAAMAICGAYGTTTNRDLSGLGRILGVAIWGLIIVGLIGLFVHFSAGMNMLYAIGGLVIFTGYFVFDFWRLKEAGKAGENSWGMAMLMAMSIYLDFLNFFLYLLQLISSGKSKD